MMRLPAPSPSAADELLREVVEETTPIRLSADEPTRTEDTTRNASPTA